MPEETGVEAPSRRPSRGIAAASRHRGGRRTVPIWHVDHRDRGLFAAVVAGAVLVVGGHPRSYAVAVVVGALLVVAVLALVSSRTSRTTAAPYRPEEPNRPVSTASRRGRRRRR
jgi:hypothetical protein